MPRLRRLREAMSFRLMNNAAVLEKAFRQKILLTLYLTTKSSRDLPQHQLFTKMLITQKLGSNIGSNIGRNTFIPLWRLVFYQLIPLSSPISDLILTQSQVSSQIETKWYDPLRRKEGVRGFNTLAIIPIILYTLPPFIVGKYEAQRKLE